MKMRAKAYFRNGFPNSVVKKDYKVPIYRIFKLQHIQEFISNGFYWVPQTLAWEDPYENFLAKSKHSIGQDHVSYQEYIDSIYGQCWSMNRETDALWRIYSPDNNSIKVKTTLAKLAEASTKEIDADPYTTEVRVVGKVDYLTKTQVNKWVEEKRLIDKGTIRNSLFIKRMEFKHENEVRMLIHKVFLENIERPKLIGLQLDPNWLIDEITFDPRLSKKEYEVKKLILFKLGYTGRITRSRLYEFEPLDIKR